MVGMRGLPYYMNGLRREGMWLMIHGSNGIGAWRMYIGGPTLVTTDGKRDPISSGWMVEDLDLLEGLKGAVSWA